MLMSEFMSLNPTSTPWSAPRVGGNEAPSAEELQKILNYTSGSMISLCNKTTLGSKSTVNESIRATMQWILDRYADSFSDHTLKSCMGKLVFPLQVNDRATGKPVVATLTPTIGSTWRFLYCSDEEFLALYPAPAAEAAAQPLCLAVAQTPACLQHLKDCGYHICSSDPSRAPQQIRDLAAHIAGTIHLSIVKNFLQKIRENLDAVEGTRISFDYGRYSAGQSEFHALVNELKSRYFFLTYENDRTLQLFTFTLTKNPVHMDILRGIWLEIHLREQLPALVQRIAAAHHLPCSVAFNVALSEEESSLPVMELDAVFTIGDQFFWVEAKSSASSNPEKYRVRGIKLKAVPDHLLYLSAGLTDADIETMEYLFPFRFANCAGLAAAVESMAGQALTHTGSAALPAAV